MTDEWHKLGNEAAQMGGKLSGRVMWLYAELQALGAAGWVDRSAAEAEYDRLKAVRADTAAYRRALLAKGPVEGVHEATWARWAEWLRARLAVLAAASPGPSQARGSVRVGGVDISELVGLGAARYGVEAQRLQALLREAEAEAATAAEDGWEDTSPEVRARHSQRCLSRAELFVAAGRDRRRFGDVPVLRLLDRRLCRRSWAAYYELSLEWSGGKRDWAVRQAWVERVNVRLATGEVVVGAREWDWATDVADAVDSLNEIIPKWGGRGRALLSQELDWLRAACVVWSEVVQ